MKEWLDWGWVADHQEEILELTRRHAWLSFVAVAIGFAISLPLSIYAYRHQRFYGPLTGVAGVLYTIPSLALFGFLYPFTGLGMTTAEIGLVSYTLLILIRNIVTGLRAVPADAKEAATAMGLSQRELLWKVELPLALPAIIAGLRIATVTVIGLVTVTALVGEGGLGVYILQGIRRFFTTAIVVGAALSVALAIVAEIFLVGVERVLSPWARGRRTRVA
jgi:osmoprotectant transport system permease protein